MDGQKSRKIGCRRAYVFCADSAGTARKWFLLAITTIVLAGVTTIMLATMRRSPPTSETATVVALPMYEVSPAIVTADDVFWRRLSARLASGGIDVPTKLERTRGALLDQWRRNDLLLSQTCGYPYVHQLMQRGVKIVGTPVYATNGGLPAGDYRSVVIVKANSPYASLSDLKGKKAGVNDMGSNSGMNAFRAAVASAFPTNVLRDGIFATVKVTGGHLNSVRMVASGEIDVAAIDSVSYDLITENYPDLAKNTRVLMDTPAAPGLPLITSAQTDDATIEKMRAAIKDTVTNPDDAELRKALKVMKIKDFVVIDEATYARRIDELEQSARDKGYPVLR
jgi:ABC-type phosphate/phosphonate transport system substrate-binding protein